MTSDAEDWSSVGLPEKYRILAKLGTGGMGAVYRAVDTVLDRHVAVKVLDASYAQDAAFVQRFLTEARSVARLNHPNIVQVYEFGWTDNGSFLAMEYVDGPTIGDRLEKAKRFPEGESVDIARQACRALRAAHEAGIIHRDVKPDNMMVTSTGTFKLVDLGLAKVLASEASQTQTGVAMGTPHYISPEQVRGDKNIDHRTDIYSLGASLYQFATGQFPFAGSSAAHVMARHLRDPLPDPRTHAPTLSTNFCSVVAKMMAKRADDRYQDMREVDKELALIEQGWVPGASGEFEAATALATPETQALIAAHAQEPWDDADRRRVEAALTNAIGPLARVLVARRADALETRDARVTSLAEHVNDPLARKTFLSACGLSPHAASRAQGAPAAAAEASEKPTPGAEGAGPAVVPADVTRLTQLLAESIGPIARVLVRRAAKKAPGLPALIDALAAQVDDPAQRAAFVRAARG